MNPKIIESTVEEATLEYLAELGYSTAFAPEISPGGLSPERESHGDVILADRLRTALYRLNPNIPREAVEEAFLKVARLSSASLYDTNHNFHYWLVNGVPVEYFREDRTICGDQVKLFDFDNPENNDFLAVNQFTVIEAGRNRRADVVIFVNGLPLAVIELKNPGDENATTHGAFNQLQTYKQDIPSLFHYNELGAVHAVAYDRRESDREAGFTGTGSASERHAGTIAVPRFNSIFYGFQCQQEGSNKETRGISSVSRGQQSGRLHAESDLTEGRQAGRSGLAHARER
jgi:hypothetical protein